MATARNQLKPRFLSIRPTIAGLDRLAALAARWGEAYFYFDNLRLAVANTEREELGDCLILVTKGAVTNYEIKEMLVEELL